MMTRLKKMGRGTLFAILALAALLLAGSHRFAGTDAPDSRTTALKEVAVELVSGAGTDDDARRQWNKAAAENPLWIIRISCGAAR